ncbi:MAG: alpha/beta hydrolase [Bacteroidetes bacterium]|nr:alpha/beta hydrolase [Bacteroidota bacterium]MBU1679461.1 alpha/beta hydrolase [Bacteroidota bacterium]MBU2508566.1 alpha/beta hydrolase [Bacteroidota bacterium]
MRKVINSLVVETSGKQSNQAIVFIHGFPFDHTMWENQVNVFKKNYYCVAYDIRGLGASYVGDAQYTMQAFVADLFSIISGLNLKNPIICGLSMGGYIALRAVELNQNIFKALILCDTKADADTDSAKLARSEKINQINVDGLEVFIDEFVPNCFCDEFIKEKSKIVFEVIAKAKSLNPLGVKGSLLAMMTRTSTSDYLKNIIIPTLAVCGSFDTLTPTTVMRNMAEQIPYCEFAVAPRAGHLAPLENPEFVNDAIGGFLKKIGVGF